MEAHHLRVLRTSVLVLLVSATAVSAPVAAQTPLAPQPFDCSPVTEIRLGECQAPVALYRATNGPGWAG